MKRIKLKAWIPLSLLCVFFTVFLTAQELATYGFNPIFSAPSPQVQLSGGEFKVDQNLVLNEGLLQYIQDFSTSVSSNELNSNYRLFPNPLKEALYINIEDAALTYSLNSSNGIINAVGKLNVGQNIILFEDYPAGTYFLTIKDLEGNFKTEILTKIK